MIRETPDTQAMLIEYGFLDNTADAQKLKNNWEEYAEAVVRAIASYIGVPYISNSGNYYTVQKGDSLWSIAKKFNTTVDKIKELNNLSSNLLSIGQVLKVNDESSETPINDNVYVVKAGDTLYSIANKYGITVNEIKELNNLNGDVLSVGQKLIVKPSDADTNLSDYYIVQKGDTLYGIANKFGLTVDNLKDINNLSSNNLSIGQKLLINSNYNDDEKYLTYSVNRGDTLYSIAEKYNTTVDAIKSINGLTSNNLSIGQVLKIPKNNIYKVYTVEKGDTLYSIARKFNTTVSNIEKLNNLTTSVLSVGQKLLVP